MPNSFTIDVDTAALREAFLTLPEALKPFIKAASRISADHIAVEAHARLERQLSGTSSGRTLAGIVVKADRTGWGWIVDAGNRTMPMLDRWLEKGTKERAGRGTMTARPFFWASAKLEEQAHRDRIRAAVGAGLSEHGLGDVR